MNHNINNKIKITVENPDGKSMEISIHENSNIEQWIDVLKTILFFQTFHPQLIEECFVEN